MCNCGNQGSYGYVKELEEMVRQLNQALSRERMRNETARHLQQSAAGKASVVARRRLREEV